MLLGNGLTIFLWVFLVHVAGIYLFTSGFLLTRLSLSESTQCHDRSCTVPPTHKRAVLLIIDALRFDFVTPDPPEPASPYHHNVLTLPRELTSKRPQHSFLFNAHADPPTTTLQRIKGLTTGSLPTFVDLGNNFGGSSIEEDSVVKQLTAAGKKSAFMGDDTWMSVFPNSFEPNMTHPYDSFNVEDLHTVDNGVIEHLFPLLRDPSKPFDLLVGHFLGVDHVGHRVGPDHPKMSEKLTQMNNVLERVVEELDEDTLLVVLGDHGMDKSGDHGGDGILETSSALWIYSKGPPLAKSSPPSGILQYRVFPDTEERQRWVQQIDILPTVSLLLGLPIPFNNLGTIIPELFWRDKSGKDLYKALELNALQIKNYLDAYRLSGSGGELDEAWDRLQSAWTNTRASTSTGEAHLVRLVHYNRLALSACRTMWAQFNPLLMGLGLVVITVGLIGTFAVYLTVSQEDDHKWDSWLGSSLWLCTRISAGAAIVAVGGYLALESFLPGMDPLDCILILTPLVSALAFISTANYPPLSLKTFSSISAILVLHSATFFSNSFTFWEDRILQFFLVTAIVPYAIEGFRAPISRLRKRILGFSLLFAVCSRLMAISTVCREEQQPYCHVTFYASSSLPVPPKVILILALPAAIALPSVIQRFLGISRSDSGIAKIFLSLMLRPALVGAAIFWLLEWADSASILGEEYAFVLRQSRTWIARLSLGWICLFGGSRFTLSPICLDFETDQAALKTGKKQVNVIGFANAFGSPYLLFWCIGFGMIHLSMQLTAQIVLALTAVALLSFLEVVDSVRDARAMALALKTSPSSLLNIGAEPPSSPSVIFGDIVPIALLGLHAFYATGHQATISSIQWKSAFILTPTVTYPFAPLTVILNSFGPLFLAGLAVPLVALWNRSPETAPKSQETVNGPDDILRRGPRPDDKVQKETVLAGLGIMMYFGCLLLGAAVSASILRRHLMVWKVFAPRFMLAAVSVLAVDLGVLVGYSMGVSRICWAISKISDAMSKKTK